MNIDDLKKKLEKLRQEWKDRPDMRPITEKRAKIIQALLNKHENNL